MCLIQNLISFTMVSVGTREGSQEAPPWKDPANRVAWCCETTVEEYILWSLPWEGNGGEVVSISGGGSIILLPNMASLRGATIRLLEKGAVFGGRRGCYWRTLLQRTPSSVPRDLVFSFNPSPQCVLGNRTEGTRQRDKSCDIYDHDKLKSLGQLRAERWMWKCN